MLKITSGYYEAAYIEVENEEYLEDLDDDFKAQQLERFSNFFKDIKKEFQLTELSAGPAASNGERGYSIVRDDKEESLEENKNDDFKNLTIEDMFFKVANKKFNVFDKNGHFTKQATALYDEVAKRYGDYDKFDALCREEGCFEENESLEESNKKYVLVVNGQTIATPKTMAKSSRGTRKIQ